jgi:hypothetical protein
MPLTAVISVGGPKVRPLARGFFPSSLVGTCPILHRGEFFQPSMAEIAAVFPWHLHVFLAYTRWNFSSRGIHATTQALLTQRNRNGIGSSVYFQPSVNVCEWGHGSCDGPNSDLISFNVLAFSCIRLACDSLLMI